jgi:hypothetical protein
VCGEILPDFDLKWAAPPFNPEKKLSFRANSSKG